MTKTCASILQCATACVTGTSMDPLGCATACAAGATGTAKTNYVALVTCIQTACASMEDGGVAEIKGCAGTAIATTCKTQAATCGGS